VSLAQWAKAVQGRTGFSPPPFFFHVFSFSFVSLAQWAKAMQVRSDNFFSPVIFFFPPIFPLSFASPFAKVVQVRTGCSHYFSFIFFSHDFWLSFVSLAQLTKAMGAQVIFNFHFIFVGFACFTVVICVTRSKAVRERTGFSHYFSFTFLFSGFFLLSFVFFAQWAKAMQGHRFWFDFPFVFFCRHVFFWVIYVICSMGEGCAGALRIFPFFFMFSLLHLCRSLNEARFCHGRTGFFIFFYVFPSSFVSLSQ